MEKGLRHSALVRADRVVYEIFMETKRVYIYMYVWEKRAPSRDKSDNKMSTNHLILILSLSLSHSPFLFRSLHN